MKTILRFTCVLLLGACGALGGESGRGQAAGAAGAESTGECKYAPDRKVEIRHLAIDVTPDFQKRTIRGEVTLTFTPIAKPLTEIRLDSVDLSIDEVECTAKAALPQVTDKEIVITFETPVPPGQETKLTIRYHGQPVRGLYFRVPSNGYRAEEMCLWTQGESIEARNWFPSYDYPNAKFTTEVTCRVPEGMTVLSNGRQVSAVKDSATGLVAVRWLQDKPHANYLVMLAAGYFAKLEEMHRDVPLRFYVPPGDAKEAPLTFAETKPAMEFFEREIGVPFPWAQYGQVIVRDFHWGGMENTTLTTLNDYTLHRPETENITTSEGLVAHELAHQWFGDLVTCKDWGHVWLNEGFATYYTLLYAGHRHGRDEMLYGLYRDARHIMEKDGASSRPIVYRKYGFPVEQFDYRSYPKGSWVLHMLRSQLGEELYRRCIRTYLERHAFGTAVTEDLSSIVEELSGRSYDAFFDQWVYRAPAPSLEVAYGWEQATKLARISVRQVQPVDDSHPAFRFPLLLRFMVNGKPVDHRVEVREKEETFYAPLPAQPQVVRVDPELELLAKIDFRPPHPMLMAQLADPADMVGRLIAVEQLAAKGDLETVARLKETLSKDPFYGVRIKASESLRKIHTDEALEALAASTKQADARVRSAVVSDIAGFFHPKALAALRECLETERNPAIQAVAIRGLGPYHQPFIRETLLKFLGSESYRNRLAEAAIAAMRAQDDPSYAPALREALVKREADFTSGGLGDGLEALGYLSRNEKSRDEVREFLTGYLNHKRERLRLSAMRALAALEDPKAIAILETFASADRETPLQQESQKSIAALRAVNKPADNLKDLRQEVLDMKKENQRLDRELNDLKKRLDAGPGKKESTTQGAKTPD